MGFSSTDKLSCINSQAAEYIDTDICGSSGRQADERDSAEDRLLKHPAIPYVAPFILFIAFLALGPIFSAPPWVEYPTRVVVVSAALLLCSRHLLNLKMTRPLGSVILGLVVFGIWIAADLIWPSYRSHWLFQNPLVGAAGSPQTELARTIFLIFRVVGTTLLVPIIEEFFWRGWLMRYLIDQNFLKVALGTYAGRSFWLTALLFASEHGPYWEVGLLAGILYGWWILKTKNLTDCIFAHAVTNGCLAAYVLIGGQWQYWL
jgi:CAAX prenyl protease-like protein